MAMSTASSIGLIIKGMASSPNAVGENLHIVLLKVAFARLVWKRAVLALATALMVRPRCYRNNTLIAFYLKCMISTWYNYAGEHLPSENIASFNRNFPEIDLRK